MCWMEGHISHCGRVLLRCHPVQSLCSDKFGCCSFIKQPLNSLFSNSHVENTCVFSWATIGSDFTGHFTSDSVLETKRLQAKELNSTCRTIKFVNYCRMWTLMVLNFDYLTFLTACCLPLSLPSSMFVFKSPQTHCQLAISQFSCLESIYLSLFTL